MKKRNMSLVTKVAGFSLALSMALAIPVKEVNAAHSSGGGHRYNEFNIIDADYVPSREVVISYKDGRPSRYMFVFVTYNGSVLEIYDWDTAKRIAIIYDAVKNPNLR